MEQPRLSPRGLDLSLHWPFHWVPILSTAVRPPLSSLLYSLFTPSSAALVKWGHVPRPYSAKVLAHDQVPKGPLRKNAILSNLSGKYLNEPYDFIMIFKNPGFFFNCISIS